MTMCVCMCMCVGEGGICAKNEAEDENSDFGDTGVILLVVDIVQMLIKCMQGPAALISNPCLLVSVYGGGIITALVHIF